MQSFDTRLSEFIKTVSWTYAETMPEWPHEYIVKNCVDDKLYNELVKHIRKYGYEGMFYQKSITYFDHEGMVYWTMEAPVEETTIINRCKNEATYEARLKKGTLPGRD